MDKLKKNKGYLAASLSHDLFTVETENRKYYGGSQNLYPSAKDRKRGCGITGAADIIMYLKSLETGNYNYPLEEFIRLSEELGNKYLPIIPGRGVNAFTLAWGLNRYFKKYGMKFRSRWKWTGFRKWKILEKMLREDIPVIIAIGNNFPIVWGKKTVGLYVKDGGKAGTEPAYKKVQNVFGHFVVATAIEDNCLTVSSWGYKYYINIDEYKRYVLKYSTHLYCNILEIHRT